MYKINQFSKISGLTVKALRYYDQEGILQPAFRNEENQYRYYNDDNLKKAQLIKYLRSLDFSIMEIKVDNCVFILFINSFSLEIFVSIILIFSFNIYIRSS